MVSVFLISLPIAILAYAQMCAVSVSKQIVFDLQCEAPSDVSSNFQLGRREDGRTGGAENYCVVREIIVIRPLYIVYAYTRNIIALCLCRVDVIVAIMYVLVI